MSSSENLSSYLCSKIARTRKGEAILERCGVLCQAVHSTSFAGHALDEHSDGHSAREGVRVNDDVRLDSTFAERHIDRRPFLGADTFLPVPGGEFVTDHRRTRDSKGDVDLLQLSISSITACNMNQFKHQENRNVANPITGSCQYTRLHLPCA